MTLLMFNNEFHLASTHFILKDYLLSILQQKYRAVSSFLPKQRLQPLFSSGIPDHCLSFQVGHYTEA